MSEAWIVIGAKSGDYSSMTLVNRSLTPVNFSKRVSVYILGRLLNSMEEAKVPIAFTDGLNEIKFTILRSDRHGDYLNGRLRISCGPFDDSILDKTLVHELGHHVDENEGISDMPEIMSEKKRKAKFLSECNAKTNVFEYVAIGFEVYYFGTKEQKRSMKHHNKILWNTIAKLHRKYRK